jgi:site-specific recombinase XerD
LEKEALEKAAQEQVAKKRLDRKSRVRQKIRQKVTFVEFKKILDIASNSFAHEHVRARVMVALTLLYLTGLRLSNLLELNVQQINDLLEKGEMDIKLIKGGKDRHFLSIGARGRSLLRDLINEINLLQSTQINGKEGYFFHSMEDPNKPFDKTNLNKQCNRF